jgi:hypothetical protein
MPGPENKPEIIHASDIEPTELPVRVEDGKDTVIVHKNDSGTVFMRYWHEEQSVVSVAITPEQVHITLFNGGQLQFPRNTLNQPSPLPLQAETPQPEQEQQPAKEKESTILVSGSFEKNISYHQVNRKNKKTQQQEKQWLHKFLLRVPNETPDAHHMQIVLSLGDAAQRHKQMNLQPGEEIAVKGYMQHRTNTKTGEETDELFAFTIRRKKPQEQPPDA